MHTAASFTIWPIQELPQVDICFLDDTKKSQNIYNTMKFNYLLNFDAYINYCVDKWRGNIDLFIISLTATIYYIYVF